MKVINPSTGHVIREVQEDAQLGIQQKYDRVKAGQTGWAARSLPERVAIMNRFFNLLEVYKEENAQILSAEVGKPLQQSRNEIAGARTRIAWLLENAGKYLSEEVMHREDGLEERIVYEPLGVVCNISAWNYPYLVGVNVFVPALLAGNAVIYKPSEYATLSGLQIEKMLLEAGIPDSVFSLVAGGAHAGQALLDLPFDGFFFTGSYKTGKTIYEKVAPRMVPCQCELGGKDPLFVADDITDVAAVAAATADGAFYNNGQSCCAVERIYVHEHIYDAYIEHFIREVKGWKIGASTDEGVYIGPLTRENQIQVIEEQVSDALQKGARLETGGKRVRREGYFFEPTVLTGVNHSMKLMKDESFGPVIGIMKVNSDEEAIALMNDTTFGLTAAVYCASEVRAQNILSKINAGTGYWNCCDRVSPALPWGGRKNSGIGSTLSHLGLRAFTRPKAYHLRTC